MLDPTGLSTLAAKRILDEVVKRAVRVRAERTVAQGATIPDLFDDVLKPTLQRLQTGGLTESWWRDVFVPLAHQDTPRHHLEHPAVRQWLRNAQVGHDLFALTKAALLPGTTHDADVRQRLAERYIEHTGVDHRAAEAIIDLVVSVLVAGFLADIPRDQKHNAALILGLSEQTYSRSADPVTREAHTTIATEALQSILSTRDFGHTRPEKAIQELLHRVTDGDLSATDEKTTDRIRYWTARLCASEPATLDLARKLRSTISTNDAALDLTIVDALIAETAGDTDLALQTLRDPHSQDQRSAWFATLARVRSDASALQWFEAQDDSKTVEFFSALGWRNWGLAMARTGKWSEAADYLVRFEKSWPETPSLALLEGIINAAMLLPDKYRQLALDSVPLYPRICVHHTDGSIRYHARATRCLGAVQDHAICQKDRRIRDYIHTWLIWLDLMNPDTTQKNAARNVVTNRLNAGRHDAVSLVPFAWVFDIPYDNSALKEWLRHREEYGGLKPPERLAECLVNHGAMSAHDFVDYVKSHRKELDVAVPVGILAPMTVYALLDDNQFERAQGWFERAKDDLPEPLRTRIALEIKKTPADEKHRTLVTRYQKTQDLSDLKGIVANLVDSKSKDTILPYLHALFEKERTVDNARLLVSRSDSVEARLLFLEENSDLVVLSDDLQAMKAAALFTAGRFEEAQLLNQALLKTRTDWKDIHLACGIAISTGDWVRVPDLVGKEWRHRHSLEAEQLIQLAYFASETGDTHDKAIELAQLAAEKAPEKPDILMAAYTLHTQLGRDSEVDPAWLVNAADQSSQDSGPVWTISPPSIVEDWLPRRRAFLRRMEEELVAGRIPFSVAVEQFHAPLSTVFLHASEQNAELPDGRNRGILPIVVANKDNLEIKAEWTVGLDPTSVLVLEYLGLLGSTLRSLHKVALPAEIFEWLFIERRTVRFHQPSLVREAKHLIAHCRSEKIRPIEISQAIDKQLSDEIGTRLAGLLDAAQRTGGLVVCARPIYRPDSMMQKEAQTDDFEELLITPLDLFLLLHREGQLSQADLMRARQFLSAPHGRPSPGVSATALHQPIHVARLALGQIQGAGLLSALTSAGLDLRIHPEVLTEAEALATRSDLGTTLVARIDGIRNMLRKAIEEGSASQLHRTLDDADSRLTAHHAFNSTASLLGSAGLCDAVCIDDRSLNRHGGFYDSNGQFTPIACVLDVLRTLRDRQTITAGRYRSARHRLRRGGFAFVPPERDELSYWVKNATIDEDNLIEGVELQAIRQALARTAVRRIATDEEAVVLESRLMATMAKAILDIWTEPGAAPDKMQVRANYLWRQATELVGLTHRILSPEAQRASVSELLADNLMCLFFPRGFVSAEIATAYGRWIEQRVLPRLLPANADAVHSALDAVHREIRSSHERRTVLGHLFFAQLPEQLRQDAIAKDPDFARRCGIEIHQTIQLSKEVSIKFTALANCVQSSFNADLPEQITADEGGAITIETNTKKPYVTANWTDNRKATTVGLPDFALLSPTAKIRDAALERIENRCSLAFHDFGSLLRDAKQRALTPDELDSVFREASQGVDTTQAVIERKHHPESVISRADIVPERLDYFDRFAGPDPGTTPPEQYLRETLAPYRQRLLARDLPRGLEVGCLGALRDDLCPGQWLSNVSNDKVWTALTKTPLQEARSPFALLGILDVALYRLDDKRFLERASRTATILADDDLKRQDGVDIYRLLEVLTSLVRNRINLLEGGATRPGYWKRMCALMHAGWMCRILDHPSFTPAMDSFEIWARGQMVTAGEYAAFVDARSEPLLEAGLVHAQLLQDEVLGRLRLLQVRHESDGRTLMHSDQLGAAFEKAAAVQNRVLGFPGPLEVHKIPEATIPTAALRAVEKASAAGGQPSSLKIMALLSQRGVLAREDLCRARGVVRDFGRGKNSENFADALTELSWASVIAAAHRDIHLADTVGEVLERLSAAVSTEDDIHKIVGIALQCAAAYKAERDWSNWLEGRLQLVAEALPGPPNKALGAFIALLREIEVVVPSKLWFHIPARTVALSGAA